METTTSSWQSSRKRRLQLPSIQFKVKSENGALASPEASWPKVVRDGETFSSGQAYFREEDEGAIGTEGRNCELGTGKEGFDEELSSGNDADAKEEESGQDDSFRESFYKSGTDWACLYEIDAYGMPHETSDNTENKHPRLDPGSKLVQTKLASFWSRKSAANNGLKNEQEKGSEIASTAAKFWAKFRQPKAVVLPAINGSAPSTKHWSKGAGSNPGSTVDFKVTGKRRPYGIVAKSCPFYKWIAGTSFTVDAFRYGAIQGCSAYFLTHFHYDHYGGLTKSWSHGPIYCTPVTARLVVQCLYVDPRWIHPIPFGTALVMEGVEVKMLDANHCPGAAIIVFQLKDGRSILHTGDFRASKQLHTYPDLMNKQINTLYLDTTYCNPRYRFPPQENVISFVVEITRAALKRNSKTLVVVGAYSIGKERVFLGIAEALGVDIFVENRRKKILSSLDWPELSCRLCTDPGRTNLHVLPIGSLQAKKLNAYLQGLPRFTSILAFRPTGWTFSESIGEELHMLKPTVSGAVTTYGVPYSEHSSFVELQDFVKKLNAYLQGLPRFTSILAFRPTGWTFSESIGEELHMLKPTVSGAVTTYGVPYSEHSSFVELQDFVKKLNAYLQGLPRFTSILAFRPTGWTFSESIGEELHMLKPTVSGAVTTYGVPYSEHSSFVELQDFVKFLRPDKIIPTVNIGKAEERERMQSLFRQWLAS